MNELPCLALPFKGCLLVIGYCIKLAQRNIDNNMELETGNDTTATVKLTSPIGLYYAELVFCILLLFIGPKCFIL